MVVMFERNQSFQWFMKPSWLMVKMDPFTILESLSSNNTDMSLGQQELANNDAVAVTNHRTVGQD